jgi:N-ethylmaleimide reductase
MHHAYLRNLGADEVIDYRITAFWEVVQNVDLVLDLVGGPALTGSWPIVAEHGRIVSTAAPEIATQTPPGKRGI